MSEQVEIRGHRWLARSRTGFVVSVLSFAIPIAFSISAAYVASVLLPRPAMGGKLLLWWGAILIIAWVAAVVGERLARPLLPLASLLKMSLLFPDMAPSRFAVAWRSGSTRQLARYVNGLDHSHHREPVTAAAEILTLVTALSSHDRRTRGHSERVRAYTDLLAEELRLPQADRDRLRWSALLHDVGKISVDVDILNKTGAPSELEWEVLHQHPLEGKRMIEPLHEWLGQWGLAVEQHHENFDGTGYPFGISGDAISLGARIVAVADAFEVMTAARSYKSAMSPSAARKELTRCAGTQFDPAIVRAFLNISVGRQRWVIGPLAWLFDVPIVGQLSNLGNAITVGSQVAIVAGSVTLGAAAAGGQVLMHSHPARSASVTTTVLVRHHAVAGPAETAIGLDVTTQSVVVGGDVRANATILGTENDLTGTVTYDVFNNGACSSTNGGLVAAFGPLAVTGEALPESPDWVATVPAGTYYFVATYSGDANHRAAVSGCSAVPITLKPAATAPTSTTTAPPATTDPPPNSSPSTTTVPPATTTTTSTTTTTTTTTLRSSTPTSTTTTDAPTTTTTLRAPPTTTTTLKPTPTTTTTLKPTPTTTTTTPTPPPTTTTTFPACKWWYTPGCQKHSIPYVEPRKVN